MAKKRIYVDGELVTSVGTPGLDTNVATEKAVRDAIAAISSSSTSTDDVTISSAADIAAFNSRAFDPSHLGILNLSLNYDDETNLGTLTVTNRRVHISGARSQGVSLVLNDCVISGFVYTHTVRMTGCRGQLTNLNSGGNMTLDGCFISISGIGTIFANAHGLATMGLDCLRSTLFTYMFKAANSPQGVKIRYGTTVTVMSDWATPTPAYASFGAVRGVYANSGASGALAL